MQYHLKKLTLLLPECVPQPANPLAPPISVVFAGAGVHQGDVNSDEDLLPGEERAADSLSSGQHSPAGGEQITGSPPPVRRAFTGETQPRPAA